MPALSSQQKHFDGSMSKLISLSLVGSLPQRVLYNRKEDLKGIFLCHNKELFLFLTLLSRISSQADE